MNRAQEPAADHDQLAEMPKAYHAPDPADHQDYPSEAPLQSSPKQRYIAQKQTDKQEGGPGLDTAPLNRDAKKMTVTCQPRNA